MFPLDVTYVLTSPHKTATGGTGAVVVSTVVVWVVGTGVGVVEGGGGGVTGGGEGVPGGGGGVPGGGGRVTGGGGGLLWVVVDGVEAGEVGRGLGVDVVVEPVRTEGT